MLDLYAVAVGSRPRAREHDDRPTAGVDVVLDLVAIALPRLEPLAPSAGQPLEPAQGAERARLVGVEVHL